LEGVRGGTQGDSMRQGGKSSPLAIIAMLLHHVEECVSRDVK